MCSSLKVAEETRRINLNDNHFDVDYTDGGWGVIITCNKGPEDARALIHSRCEHGAKGRGRPIECDTANGGTAYFSFQSLNVARADRKKMVFDAVWKFMKEELLK